MLGRLFHARVKMTGNKQLLCFVVGAAIGWVAIPKTAMLTLLNKPPKPGSVLQDYGPPIMAALAGAAFAIAATLVSRPLK